MTTPPASRRSRLRLHASARAGLLVGLGTVGALGAIVFAVSLVLGLRPLAITSGSMEPTLPVGCVVVSRTVPATEVQVGGIVTLQRLRGRGPVTGRVVRATARGGGAVELVLRGDADARDDPEHYVAGTAGVYVMQVPWLGYLVTFLQGPGGLPVAALLLALLAVLFFVVPARTGPPGRGAGQRPY